MAYLDPSSLRLSKHFLLSDFMANHSIFTRGLCNQFQNDQLRIDNGVALCEQALEPILEQYGALSVGYGYISPEVSREIVTYMDPNKPSHHRWDLGAAADICVHEWTNVLPDDDTAETAPIRLAHSIDQAGVPYSRLISYSESPYLCMAVSAREVEQGRIRKAFYENRWDGRPKQKPDYRTYSNEKSRARAFQQLVENDLPKGWRGAGYPTYHGGGRRQYQHVRVSQYSMLSDWLMDLQSIAHGEKNIPNLGHGKLWDTFCAVGDAYDEILEKTGCKRMSIIAGFVSPANRFFDPSNDWRTGRATFSLVPPEGMTADEARHYLIFGLNSLITGFGDDPNVLDITVEI